MKVVRKWGFTPPMRRIVSNAGRQLPKRQPGAGRPGSLNLSERLLLSLIYLHLYMSQSLIAFFFDIDYIRRLWINGVYPGRP